MANTTVIVETKVVELGFIAGGRTYRHREAVQLPIASMKKNIPVQSAGALHGPGSIPGCNEMKNL